MAINEQEFDAALTDFVMSLDAGLAAIQAKLDAMGVGSDFTDELQTLSDAKTKLTDFVAKNTEPPAEPPIEEPPIEEPPVEEPPVS